MNKRQLGTLRKLVNRDRHRNFNILGVEKRESGEDVAKFSASSEEPIYAWVDTQEYSGPGFEVLGHGPDDINMERKDIMHFLLDHQATGVDNNLGMVREFKSDGKKVHAVAEKNPHNPVAERVFKEIESGFRPGISVGFMRAQLGTMVDTKDGLPVVRYSWTPYEMSSVLIPADKSVGVGRSIEDLVIREFNFNPDDEKHQALVDELVKEFCPSNECDGIHIDGEETTRSAEAESAADANKLNREQEMSEKNEPQAAPVITVGPDLATERNRTNEIYRLGKEDNQLALSVKAVSEGWSLERFKSELHDVARTGRQVNIVDQPNVDEKQASELDIRQAMFNFLKSGESSPVDELGREIARDRGIQTRKNALYIPIYVPMKNARSFMSRILQTSPSANGGALVGTEFYPLAPALFEGQATSRVGVQFHDVRNQVQVPRFSNNMPAGFVGEGASISLSSGSFATDTATPHQVVAAVGITPHLGMALDGTYSPIDSILSNMISKVREVAERSFWSGSATAEPGGLVNNTSILHGPAATGSLTAYAEIWEDLRNASVMSYLPYVASTDVFKYGLLSAALSGGSEYATLVQDITGRYDAMSALGGVINTAFLPAKTLIAGDWSQALYFTFGVMEARMSDVQVLSGNDVLLTRLFVDNVIQQPSAFCAITGSVVVA